METFAYGSEQVKWKRFLSTNKLTNLIWHPKISFSETFFTIFHNDYSFLALTNPKRNYFNLRCKRNERTIEILCGTIIYYLKNSRMTARFSLIWTWKHYRYNDSCTVYTEWLAWKIIMEEMRSIRFRIQTLIHRQLHFFMVWNN